MSGKNMHFGDISERLTKRIELHVVSKVRDLLLSHFT